MLSPTDRRPRGQVLKSPLHYHHYCKITPPTPTPPPQPFNPSHYTTFTFLHFLSYRIVCLCAIFVLGRSLQRWLIIRKKYWWKVLLQRPLLTQSISAKYYCNIVRRPLLVHPWDWITAPNNSPPLNLPLVEPTQQIDTPEYFFLIISF